MKYLVHCTKPNCFMHMTVNTEEEQTHYLANHGCPYWGGESKVSWSVTKTLVEELWFKLDDTMSDLMETQRMAQLPDGEKNYSHALDVLKARARAIAECLAIFMKPFFEDANAIAAEALRRYTARKEGDTEYETAGIGHRRYEAAARAATTAHGSAAEGWYESPTDGYTSLPGAAGAGPRRRAVRPAAPASATVKIRLSEEDQASIRKAHDGMPQIFTAKVLAKQYGATEAEVNAILKP